MTEDFLSRWARLKRESAAEPRPPDEAAMSESPSPLDPAAAPPSELAELPPIESLSAESSVAAFLQAGVPEDLTRTALRNAWVTDPTIRDFVGIAENQWDFNGEGTIPGFGSLSIEEYTRYVATRALQAEPGAETPAGDCSREEKSDNAAALNASTEEALTTTTPVLGTQSVRAEPSGESPTTTVACHGATRANSPSQTKPRHGSALPR